jgi:hypothetical protein
MDRLMIGVERLPGPYGWFYVGLALLGCGLHTGVKWWEGSYSVGQLNPFHLVFSATLAYVLWLVHYLTREALGALDVLRPSTKLSDSEYSNIRYQMQNASGLRTLLGSLLGAGFGILYSLLLASRPDSGLFGSRASLMVDSTIAIVTFFVLGGTVYRALHLLRLVIYLYGYWVQTDLLKPQPLYALSSVGARAAVAMLLYVNAFVLAVPGGLANPGVLGVYSLIVVLALMVAITPLWGAHRKLILEKRQMQEGVNERLKIAMAELYRRVDNQAMTDMDNLNKTFLSIEVSKNNIERASTWPWHPDTPRLLLTATLLPLMVWLAQRVLGRIGV